MSYCTIEDSVGHGYAIAIWDVVDCKRCDELLATYKHAISLYTTAQSRIRGLVGDDFMPAWTELKRLRQTCLLADDALMEHLGQDHGNLSEKSGGSLIR